MWIISGIFCLFVGEGFVLGERGSNGEVVDESVV